MPVALQRLWIQITADRKRFGVLCAALGVGLLLWARIILTSNVPRTAVATEDAQVAAVDGGSRDGPRAGRGQRTPVALDTRPRRDPFVISPAHFPKDAGDGVRGADPGKSAGQEADESEAAAAHKLASLRALVDRFRLEAAMSGAGIGVISGHTVRLGEFIPAVGNPEVRFELIEVSHRTVRLRYEEHVFELHMTSPGR